MVMELTKKREVWIDTIRVVASLLVLVSHYAWKFDIGKHDWFRNYFAGLGHIGVVLFFAISGYLACNSLGKVSSKLEFYKDKLVRILVPYIFTYVLMSILFVVLGMLNKEFLDLTPISKIMYVGGSYKSFLLGFFPIDNNILHYFKCSFYWFTGEWFIGTLCVLYLVSPLLYFGIKTKPVFFLCVSLVISVFCYHNGDGMLMHGFWFWLVRLPEYLIGMYIYIYKDTFSRYSSGLCKLCLAVVVVTFITDVVIYDHSIFIDRWLPLKPRSFIISLPLMCLLVIWFKELNDKFDLACFNKYSQISYVFMLSQHIVINVFVKFLDIERFSKFGVIFVLVVICLVNIFLSNRIQSIYKPIEDYLIKNYRSVNDC